MGILIQTAIIMGTVVQMAITNRNIVKSLIREIGKFKQEQRVRVKHHNFPSQTGTILAMYKFSDGFHYKVRLANGDDVKFSEGCLESV